MDDLISRQAASATHAFLENACLEIWTASTESRDIIADYLRRYERCYL